MLWLLSGAGIMLGCGVVLVARLSAENAALQRETEELRKQLRAFIGLYEKALARERNTEYTRP